MMNDIYGVITDAIYRFDRDCEAAGADVFDKLDYDDIPNFEEKSAIDTLKALVQKKKNGYDVENDLTYMFNYFEPEEFLKADATTLFPIFGKSVAISIFLIENVETWTHNLYIALLTSASIFDLPHDFVKSLSNNRFFRTILYNESYDSTVFERSILRNYLDSFLT